jgi:hypothetical protein
MMAKVALGSCSQQPAHEVVKHVVEAKFVLCNPIYTTLGEPDYVIVAAHG